MRICKVADCHKVVKAKRPMCSMHTARMSRHGRLDKKTTLGKILEHIDKRSNDCWELNKFLTKEGYGRIWHEKSQVLIHRFMYQEFKGCLLPELLVCHSCDNPKCVNPSHLWLGTPIQNIQDSISKGRVSPSLRAKERWRKWRALQNK